MSVVSPFYSLPHSTININHLNDFDDKYETPKVVRERMLWERNNYSCTLNNLNRVWPEFQVGNILFHRVQLLVSWTESNVKGTSLHNLRCIMYACFSALLYCVVQRAAVWETAGHTRMVDTVTAGVHYTKHYTTDNTNKRPCSVAKVKSEEEAPSCSSVKFIR